MKQHVSILGVLYIAFGVLGMVTAVGMLALFGGAAGIVSMVSEQEPDAAVAVPILGVLAVCSSPSLPSCRFRGSRSVSGS